MLNLQQLIERHKPNLPSYSRSVTGFLAYGGSSYYKINSDVPYSINCDSNGIIKDSKGNVQLYDLNVIEKIEKTYYTDIEYMVESKKKTKYFFEDKICKKWFDKPLSSFYLHPYFPNKKIKAFKVLRIMPFDFKVGEIINFKKDSKLNKIFTKEYCLNYPEFFKPIY